MAVKEDSELNWERIAIIGYFEGVGLLVERKLVDIELVSDLMG